MYEELGANGTGNPDYLLTVILLLLGCKAKQNILSAMSVTTSKGNAVFPKRLSKRGSVSITLGSAV